MPSPALSAYIAECRQSRRVVLNSDYDPIAMRSMIVAMDTVGPGSDIRQLGHGTLELRSGSGSAFLVYVPGGGFCFPGGDAHRALLDRVCAKTRTRGALLQHRLAPENPFPAAHDDVLLALRAVLSEEQGPVFVMCDSSAATLVLCACAQLRRERHRLPDRLICMSALTDLAMTGRSNVSNAESDPLFGPQAVIHKIFHYLQGANPAQASVSPWWDEAVTLPDTLFIVGSTEVMLDDTLRYADKAERAGTNVALSVYDDATHVLALQEGIPEADKMVDEIANFLAS